MKSLPVTLLALLATITLATADINIPIYLPGIGTTNGGDTGLIAFDNLDGAPVNGVLSFNIMFEGNEFVRIFSATYSSSFDCWVGLKTTLHDNSPGFVSGTGWLIDASGNAIPGYGVTGAASSTDGYLYLGLFPLDLNNEGYPATDIPRPLDFYGVHYEITLPDDAGVTIENGTFTITDFSAWGIGPGIPDDIPEPSVLALLVVAAISAALRSKSGKRLRHET